MNQVHETRSHAKAPAEEEKMVTRKQKAEGKLPESGGSSPKRAKAENDNNHPNGKSKADIATDFEKFCKVAREHLTIQQMREILEANDQDASCSDDAVVPKCEDMLFYGPLHRCPICEGNLVWTGTKYACTGAYSAWSNCVYCTTEPRRRAEPIILPDSVQKSPASDLLKEKLDPKSWPRRQVTFTDKLFSGMMISLSGRLTQTHLYWKSKIEKHGGKVSNSVIGATCLVVSPSERERGGSSKVTEAVERGISVVSEAWLIDSIEKKEPQPVDSYDVLSDLPVEGRGIPWDKMESSESALESLTAELKLYGKRGVHKDSRLHEEGGKIFEKDGILYNCAFSVCDQGAGLNSYSVIQLIMVPENHLHLYYKEGAVGADAKAEEKLEECDNVDSAVKEFARLFEELTGNDFELWERDKKFQKRQHKYVPVDMDDGVEVRHGGLGLRQLGVAAAHCKLDPKVASFMKILCSQEIYRYALMEMDLDPPDLPIGMLTKAHLMRCESALLEFIDKLKTMKETGEKAQAMWSDFSQKWFTLLHTSRPFNMRECQDIADHAASALECVKDITVASHLIGDMSGPTIDDPLFDRYTKLGCSISPLEKGSDDYKMIVKYLEKTYEPYSVGDISYGVSVENIFAVEVNAGPSYDDIKKLPNKVLLWCGTRSSNLLRHLHQGFLPSICSLPVPGYMFGKAIVCSDAAAEAARYGFTAVDRPEGFLVLAVVSLGEHFVELTSPPEDTESLENQKVGVKGLGRKKPDESEHFIWRDDIKVPCGRLVSSGLKDGALEYNEYAVYDLKQVSIRYLVGVKYEEQNIQMETAEPE